MKPALHASMLSMLSKCGMQVYYRYVEGIKSPPGVAMVIGTAVHRATEENLKAKMATGALLEEEAVGQLAAESLEATWLGESPMLDDDEKERGVAAVRGQAKDEAVALSRVHHRDLAPELQPIAVERKLRLELGGFPFDLEGTIDVEEAGAIRDIKTASKSPSGNEATGHPQLGMYTMMRAMIDREKPPIHTIALDYLVKLKAPKVVVVNAPAPTDFEPIKKRLELAAHVFDKGAFYPADPTGPSGWVCSRKWCGYFDLCPFGASARVSVPMNTTSNGG